jgi:hypothetical protein
MLELVRAHVVLMRCPVRGPIERLTRIRGLVQSGLATFRENARAIAVGGGNMSTRNDYSHAEWKAISAAPVAAGLLIRVSDATDLQREAVAVGMAISRSTIGDAPEVVRVLATEVKVSGGTPELPELPPGGLEQTKAALIAVVSAAVRALETTSPSEVESYKAWLASVTAKVWEAAKAEAGAVESHESSFTAAEQDALIRLAEILRVNAPEAFRGSCVRVEFNSPRISKMKKHGARRKRIDPQLPLAAMRRRIDHARTGS